MILTNIKNGVVLVAEPSLIGDISFQKSVILIANHSNTGTVGFIMNKPTASTISDFIPDVTEEYRIYNGGPVEQDNLYFIHSIPDLIPNSVKIAKNLYWGGSFEVVSQLMIDRIIEPDDIKFFLGYSGWSFNQLEDEIHANSWIVSFEENLRSLINDRIDSYWKNHMLGLGDRYSIWANAPENPEFN